MLPLLKPPAYTSHDVVAWARRRLGERRIGHTGTLDPDAAGVLLLLVGPLTRCLDAFHLLPKRYRAEIRLGLSSDTLDASGTVRVGASAAHLTATDVEGALAAFRGAFWQVPPMVSAVHAGGKRLYELARAGQEAERSPRRVTVYALTLRAFRPGAVARLWVDVHCSTGTYVRQIAADLGQQLGTGGLLGHLLRTGIGAWEISDCQTLEECAAAPRLVAPAQALGFLPQVLLSGEDAAAARRGQLPRRLPLAAVGSGEWVVARHREQVLGLGQLRAAQTGATVREVARWRVLTT